DYQKQLSRADQGLRDLKRALEGGGRQSRPEVMPDEAEAESETAESELPMPAAETAESAEPSEPEAPNTAAEAEAAGRRLFIGNLPFDWTDEHLRDTFKDAGQVAVAEIAKFRRNGRSRGFGFIEMSTESE